MARVRPCVSRDHSLDDFADAGGEPDGDEGDGTDADPDSGESSDRGSPAGSTTPDAPEGSSGTDAGGRDGETSGVDPAEPTYAWSSDGGACAACGATVEVRWRQDGDYVCPDCKEW